MKRLGNIYDKICSYDNLYKAYLKAKRGKSHYSEVIEFEKDIVGNLLKLQTQLDFGRFKFTDYTYSRKFVGKWRDLCKTPFYPDRIVHHALILQIKEKLKNSFIPTSYHCIDGRGTSLMFDKIWADIKHKKNLYALKIDIEKFYDNVNNDLLKVEVARYFKCGRTLDLIHALIDKKVGLPIGSYTSVYLANAYLNRLDWYIKQVLRCKWYYRYADDLLLVAESRATLNKYMRKIKMFLDSLKLRIKNTYQYCRVDTSAIFFCGCLVSTEKFRMTNLMRRKLVNSCKTLLRERSLRASSALCSYAGWFRSLKCGEMFKAIVTEASFRYWDSIVRSPRYNHAGCGRAPSEGYSFGLVMSV